MAVEHLIFRFHIKAKDVNKRDWLFLNLSYLVHLVLHPPRTVLSRGETDL